MIKMYFFNNPPYNNWKKAGKYLQYVFILSG